MHTKEHLCTHPNMLTPIYAPQYTHPDTLTLIAFPLPQSAPQYTHPNIVTPMFSCYTHPDVLTPMSSPQILHPRGLRLTYAPQYTVHLP